MGAKFKCKGIRKGPDLTTDIENFAAAIDIALILLRSFTIAAECLLKT